MKVDTEGPVTKKAQNGILEFLLINHPLDCPVCDKGGECPLQDHTIAYGPGESRFVEEKRHFEKPIPISETVMLDRERCILCDRCTRFADEVAGDPLISFQGRGAHTQVNTFPDQPFASYFSGNTVQICPVGALTAKPYRFKARPWDLQETESTCTACAVGCRIVVDSSRNQVLRYNGVDIDPVNWGWLCDKGRFGFEAVQSPDRLGTPLVRDGDDLVEASWRTALEAAAGAIRSAVDANGAGGVAVLGGARLTNESAYTWAKLAKAVIGTDNVDAQLGDGLPAEAVLGLPRATIDEVCEPGGTVVLLGPDLKEELPVLYLRLRHAVVNDRVTLIELSPASTGITALAASSLRYKPGEAVALVRALLDGGAVPDTADADAVRSAGEKLRAGPVKVVLGRASLAERGDTAAAAAGALLDGLDGVTFLPVLRRGNVNGALDMGLAPGVLPGRVSLDDGRDWFTEAWGAVPAERGLDALGILDAAAEGQIDTLILLGADPVSDFPDRQLARRALAGARTVIAVDQFLTDSSSMAHVVLPAAGFAEVNGSTTNIEGRVSVLGQAVTPPGTARADWIIATDLALRLGSDLGLESIEGIWAEIEQVAPSHAGLTNEVLTDFDAADGVVVPLGSAPVQTTEVGPQMEAVGGTTMTVTGEPAGTDAAEAHGASASAATASDSVDTNAETDGAEVEANVESADAAQAEDAAGGPAGGRAPSDADADDGEPAEDRSDENGRPRRLRFRPAESIADIPGRDNYSLRLVATRTLYDQGVLLQHSPSMANLAAPAVMRVNPLDFERLGVGAGEDVKVSSARGSMTIRVEVDEAVPRGSATVAFNHDGLNASDLIDASSPVTDIRVETTR